MAIPAGEWAIIAARLFVFTLAFDVICVQILHADKPPPGGTSEGVLLREFQQNALISLATYYTMMLITALLGHGNSFGVGFVCARFYETVLVPALCVLLYAAYDEPDGLPPLLHTEPTGMPGLIVRNRLPLFIMAVVTDLLTEYYEQGSTFLNIVSLLGLTWAFANAVASKYQRSDVSDTLVPSVLLIVPPGLVGMVLHSAVRPYLWYVPSEPLGTTTSSPVTSATTGTGVTATSKQPSHARRNASPVNDTTMFSDGEDTGRDKTDGARKATRKSRRAKKD
eukprot:m.206802 g.206802  ORF g.206802 m.206802 type:complete len:281 (+) comp23487_c0_seq1:79-921(+)